MIGGFKCVGRTSKAGGKVNTINKRIVGVATDDQASHIGRTDNAMTKIALAKAPTSLLECAVYISARRKLIHAMPLDTDRPINRAVVVGCVISATRNYLKLHMSRTLKVLLGNTHAETRKLWKRSGRLPPFEAIPVDQFTSRPLPHFTRPPRCSLHSPRFPGMRLVLASRLPSRAAPTCEPHSTRCSAGCHTSRDFVPWRFLDAGQLSLRSVSSSPASKNQHKSRHSALQ